MAEKRILLTPLEYELYAENQRLKAEIKKKDSYIKDLQDRLFLQQDQNHYLTSRLAAKSQEEKITRPYLEKKVSDLTMDKNELHERIQKLEKKKRPFISFKK